MPPSVQLQNSSTDVPRTLKRKNQKKKKAAPNGAVDKKSGPRRITRSDHDSSNDNNDIDSGAVPASSSAPETPTQQTNAFQNQMALGMYGSPLYGGYGGMSPMMVPGSPFSGLYQVLFGVQNVVFSLSQAVQILSMNQQAIQQAFDSLGSMFDHAVKTFYELRALEAVQMENETEQQKTRRRRLKALRWAILMGGSWLVYKLVHYITRGRRRHRIMDSAANGIAAAFSAHPGNHYPGGGYGQMYGPGTHGLSPYGGNLLLNSGGQYWPSSSYY